VKEKAPTTTPIAIGAENRAAEAERVLQNHYPAYGARKQGRTRKDVPQLPDRDGEGGVLRTDEAHDDKIGDAYTFIALVRTSKLVVAWHLGRRDRIHTEDFISKVRWATAPGLFEVCTDGFQPYVNAIANGLHDRANYSQVIKVYSKEEEGRERYSPGEFVSVEKLSIMNKPDLKRPSTSYVERQNGTLRQWCKRLTRLTYAFSKSWDNLKAALALHFAFYNFCRIHGSLKVTPAMETGVADRVWTLADLMA
jgi:IS1 family transposase